VLFSVNTSQISSYHCCEYDKRTAIEKNWAFYSERNQLFALYSLNPLTIIQASHTEAHKMEFKDNFIDDKQNFKNYSIGTPLIKLDNGYGFIAHKKITINGNRLYLGKPITLNLNKKPTLLSKPKFLIHSFGSLLGNRFKFNKQLISCTYFSGLFSDNKKLILSYGINDVNYNIVRIDQKKIWQ